MGNAKDAREFLVAQYSHQSAFNTHYNVDKFHQSKYKRSLNLNTRKSTKATNDKRTDMTLVK